MKVFPIAITILCNVLSSNAAPDFLRTNVQRKEQEEICETTLSPAPPRSSSCWSYNAANTESQKGCDNESCEAAVCACDMYCCTTSWDLNCRGHPNSDETKKWDNYFTPGCSASILCCEDKDYESYTKTSEVIKSSNKVICPTDEDIMGYMTIEGLKDDMASDYTNSLSNPKDKYEYILCPDTTFDLSGLTATNSTTVLLSDTEIKCGGDGSSSNNCKFVRGEHHLIFHPDLTVKNVLIEGIKFTNSESTSIIAWGQSDSSVTFRDCHWEDNNGYTLIDMYPSDKDNDNRRLSSSSSSPMLRSLRKINKYESHFSFNSLLSNGESHVKNAIINKEVVSDIANNDHVSLVHDSERRIQEDITPGGGMLLRINDCLLSSNELSTGLILNVAGVVDITKTSFALNNNKAVGLGISDEGTLILDTDSDFVKNINGFSTIYLDASSKLRIINKNSNSDDNKIGLATSENEGMRCNGIFVENEDSECLSTGGFETACYGICCDFGLQCYNA